MKRCHRTESEKRPRQWRQRWKLLGAFVQNQALPARIENQRSRTGRSSRSRWKSNDRLLDTLNQIKWEQDGTLTYRRSCAHGVCGSDAMRVNGRNRLACKLLMQDLGTDITVEPMLGFPVIRDLVVDMDPFFAKYEKVKPYLDQQ